MAFAAGFRRFCAKGVRSILWFPQTTHCSHYRFARIAAKYQAASFVPIEWRQDNGRQVAARAAANLVLPVSIPPLPLGTVCFQTSLRPNRNVDTPNRDVLPKCRDRATQRHHAATGCAATRLKHNRIKRHHGRARLYIAPTRLPASSSPVRLMRG